jgi:hypothetical protein
MILKTTKLFIWFDEEKNLKKIYEKLSVHKDKYFWVCYFFFTFEFYIYIYLYKQDTELQTKKKIKIRHSSKEIFS